ncbi:MAG: hypothetical protein KKH98_13150 [Spirochaetes bacterium]|nr:hypothetical protein [Spirochaetota bacterium]
MHKIFFLLLLLISSGSVSLLPLSAQTKSPSVLKKTVRTEIRAWSWSNKTGGYYQIPNTRVIIEQFNQKGELKRRSVYLKGNSLYQRSYFYYKDGNLYQIMTQDAKKRLITSSVLKKNSDGLYRFIYNDRNKLTGYQLYVFSTDGRLKEKIFFNEDKEEVQKLKYIYGDGGLLNARILYNTDGKALHMSEYQYQKFDQNGDWTVRNEVQSYGDVYAYPKEVAIRSVQDTANKEQNTLPDEGGPSLIPEFERPELSVDVFLDMTEALSKEKTPGAKVLATALKHIKAKTIIKGSCYNWIDMIYKELGYKEKKREKVFWGKESGPYADAEVLEPGDWIMFKNLTYGEIGHSGIFLGWLDLDRRSAIVIGYAGENRTAPGRFREYEITQLFGIFRGVNP